MANTLLNLTSSLLRLSSCQQILYQGTRTLYVQTKCLQKADDLIKSEYIEDNLRLQVHTNEGETIVEAIPTPTGREGKVIHLQSSSGACSLCRLNLVNLSYTDVKILSQFVKKNGSIVPYSESHICSKQYRKVVNLIKKAWRCNLMERPPDYLVPGPWHDLNTYLEQDRKRDFPMKVIQKKYWKI